MTRRFWTEIWYFLLFIAAGFGIVFLLSIPMAHLGISFAGSLHIMQWEQNILMFIVPTLCWVHWYLKQPISTTLRLNNAKPKYYLLAIVSILLLAVPMDGFVEWSKEALPWPEFLRQMADDEAMQQEEILKQLLAPSGLLGWIEIVLLMSVITAIAEEFVFRGGLLTVFRRAGINQHLSAIAVGLIFAIIHFDLYGLLPRWILGTLFCYLFFWSGSIWPPVAAHAINNLMALLQYKNGELF